MTRSGERGRAKGRRVAFGLTALALGSLLAAALLESAIRLLELAPTTGIGTVDARRFDLVPGLFMPGQDLIDRQKPALPHRVRINALGYRGPAIPDSRPTDEVRILMVGDSFTYGDFVDDDETLPAQLESALAGRALGPGCETVRAINAGVGGTTIVTHAEMARRGRVLEPDLVVLTFSENDIVDLRNPMWDSLAENRRMKSRFPLSIAYPILRHTATWNFLLKVRASWTTPGPEAGAGPVAPADAEAKQQAESATPDRRRRDADRERYREALAALRDALADEGVELLFVVYPVHHALHDEEAREQVRWAESTARGEGLPALGLVEPLQASGRRDDELYLLPHDGHPSPLGYRIAAASLAPEVARLAARTTRCSRAPGRVRNTAAPR